MRHILRHLPYLLRRALVASFDDGLFTIAKGAAYSALLSLFPVLASIATIFVQAHADYVQRNLGRFLSRILPPGTEDIVLQQFRYRGQRPVALLVAAFILSLWAASSVIKSLIDGFNAAYHVPRNRSILGHAGDRHYACIPVRHPPGGGLVADPVWRHRRVRRPEVAAGRSGAEPALPLLANVLARRALSGGLRRHRHRHRDSLLSTEPSGNSAGAVSGPARFSLPSCGCWPPWYFGWYVRNITNYNVLYGSVGTSIALLIWMYLLAAIVLFGCAFNAEIERSSLRPV